MNSQQAATPVILTAPNNTETRQQLLHRHTRTLTHHNFVNTHTSHCAIDQNRLCNIRTQPRNVLLFPTTNVTHTRTNMRLSYRPCPFTHECCLNKGALWAFDAPTSDIGQLDSSHQIASGVVCVSLVGLFILLY